MPDLNRQSRNMYEFVMNCVPLIMVLSAGLFSGGIVLLYLLTEPLEGICSNKIPSVQSENTIVIEYTNCIDTAEPARTCAVTLAKNISKSCNCVANFDLPNDLEGEVILYYELDINNSGLVTENNYFTSRDDAQLSGDVKKLPSEACGTYAYSIVNGTKRTIVPCGAIADSMFNDTFDISNPVDSDYVPILRSGIISEKDKQGFKNPPLSVNETLQSVYGKYAKPINWLYNIWELSETNDNNGLENEQFIAWMKTDWVRKPLWRLDRSKNQIYANGLKRGSYGLIITYNYPVSRYNGPRKAVVSTCTHYSIVTRSDTPTLVTGILFIIIGVAIFIWFVTYVLMQLRKQKANETAANNVHGNRLNDVNPHENLVHELNLNDIEDIPHIDEESAKLTNS